VDFIGKIDGEPFEGGKAEANLPGFRRNPWQSTLKP